MSSWRPEDEALLRRLEDSRIVEQLFDALAARARAAEEAPEAAPRLPARAAGLIACLRREPVAEDVVRRAADGDVSGVARLVGSLPLERCAPELVHHLALFHAKLAAELARDRPEAAADAWLASLSAWIVLAGERRYLEDLERRVVGPAGHGGHPPLGAAAVPIRVVGEIARRAEAGARGLDLPGRAALLALARVDEAIRSVDPAIAGAVRIEATRRRNAAIESALAPIAEALDDVTARGELAKSGGVVLLQAIAVWTWTTEDEAVEHFVVDRIGAIAWELYRAKGWDALRYLLDPFRSMFERLARRIETDPGAIAYASGCAQMFVFLAELEPSLSSRIALAERAVAICPTHRNGRLVLASFCRERAVAIMEKMVVFAPRTELERAEALLERAEAIHPEPGELAAAKAMLERVRRLRLAF